MGLRTILISIWTKKKDKDSFIANELVAMGAGKKPGRKKGAKK